jgi:hypothetical protein
MVADLNKLKKAKKGWMRCSVGHSITNSNKNLLKADKSCG